MAYLIIIISSLSIAGRVASVVISFKFIAFIKTSNYYKNGTLLFYLFLLFALTIFFKYILQKNVCRVG